MRSFMTKVTDSIESTLNKNCVSIGFGSVRSKTALVLETNVTKMVQDRPGSETVSNYNSSSVDSQMCK